VDPAHQIRIFPFPEKKQHCLWCGQTRRRFCSCTTLLRDLFGILWLGYCVFFTVCRCWINRHTYTIYTVSCVYVFFFMYSNCKICLLCYNILLFCNRMFWILCSPFFWCSKGWSVVVFILLTHVCMICKRRLILSTDNMVLRHLLDFSRTLNVVCRLKICSFYKPVI